MELTLENKIRESVKVTGAALDKVREKLREAQHELDTGCHFVFDITEITHNQHSAWCHH